MKILIFTDVDGRALNQNKLIFLCIPGITALMHKNDKKLSKKTGDPHSQACLQAREDYSVQLSSNDESDDYNDDRSDDDGDVIPVI